MEVELLNKTINEISPETLVECYNSTRYCLQTIKNELKSANVSVWQRISQMALSDDFIQDFKTKLDWGLISSNLQLNENFIREFQNFKIGMKFHSIRIFLNSLPENFKTKLIGG
jgi:hypothetical protein